MIPEIWKTLGTEISEFTLLEPHGSIHSSTSEVKYKRGKKNQKRMSKELSIFPLMMTTTLINQPILFMLARDDGYYYLTY